MVGIAEATTQNNLLWQAICSRVEALGREIYRAAGGKVLTGPFASMHLLQTASWGSGDISAKILGCYEQELHQSFEKAIGRQPEVVVHVGCAEGYYAVGVARRLPFAMTYAFDISPSAQAVCRTAAETNGVAERVVINGACTPDKLIELARMNKPMLLVMDCEGAELQLLTPPVVAALRHSDIIVECHDFVDRSITPVLSERLRQRHTVELLREGERNPARFPFLSQLGSFDRLLAVCEFRPEVMSWLACWSSTVREPGGTKP